MTVIQDIQPVRESVVRYRISLDTGQEHLVHSGTVRRLGLKVGMLWEHRQLEEELIRSEAAEAREFALRSLAARGRTASELTAILTRKGFSPREAAVTVAWVREKGLIEEQQLLEDTVESLLQRKGVHQVRQILKQRGFSPGEAERLLKEQAEDPEHFERVLILARKKMKELQTRYPEGWAARLGNWLYGKGHDRTLIRRVLDALKVPEPPEED